MCFQDCGLQLTDEQDKRCYPLDDRLFCHMCHIKRLHQEYPGEQFYIDPYTFHILNKTSGSQRDSIAIMPATMSSYPHVAPPQTVDSHSNLNNRGPPPPLPSTSSSSLDEPPPLPPHRKMVNGVNGFDSPKLYMNKPSPQLPAGNPNGMKYTITDLWWGLLKVSGK